MLRFVNLIIVGVAVSLAADASGGEKETKSEVLMKQLLEEMRSRDEAILKELKALRNQVQNPPSADGLNAKILQLQLDLAQAKLKAAMLEATARALQDRNEALAARIQQLEATLKLAVDPKAQLKSEVPDAKAPDAPKPPATNVKGKVIKVDLETGVVEINLGADQGLKVGHTLEVYRFEPRAEYVGMVRVVQVFPGRSVVRITASNPLKKQEIKVGDNVASSLSGS